MLVNSGKHFFCFLALILLSYHAVLVIKAIIRAGIVRLVEKPVILVFIKVDKADILLVVLVKGEIGTGIAAALYALFRVVFTVHNNSDKYFAYLIQALYQRLCVLLVQGFKFFGDTLRSRSLCCFYHLYSAVCKAYLDRTAVGLVFHPVYKAAFNKLTDSSRRLLVGCADLLGKLGKRQRFAQPQHHKDKLLCFCELEFILVKKSADSSSVHGVQLDQLDKAFLLVV